MEKSMTDLLREIRNDLKENADEKTRISGERFFREDVRLYGLKSSEVSRISKKHFTSVKGENKEYVFRICEELWRSGYLEESFIACNWSYNMHRYFDPDDLILFERWIIKYVTNWASCDTFCNHTIGTLIEMFPDEIPTIIQWTVHPQRWMKRASAVSLIVPAKKGVFLKEVFEIAGSLLSDRDDMVMKGCGWMLKVASQAHEKEVFDFIMKNRGIMPRTTLRYAIEKMPQHLKVQAMAK
jgi:3-methyladenine DNA glycosylase AlkD